VGFYWGFQDPHDPPLYGPRARGHLIEISDGMFGWYDLLGQPLAFMKMPLLSVPSGGQGHRSRSKVKWVHFPKN